MEFLMGFLVGGMFGFMLKVIIAILWRGDVITAEWEVIEEDGEDVDG